MKKRVFQVMALTMLCALLTVFALAADTVYVDGVGTAENCYATLKEATDAVDEGGTVILTADYATPTDNPLTLTANKTVTITSEGNKKLTLSRALILGGDTTFENITIVNGAGSNVDFIYAAGHKLVMEDSVATTANASTNRYLCLLAGKSTAATENGHIVVKGGKWRSLYGGTHSGPMSGDVYIEMYGGTITNSIFFGNLSASTHSANVYVTVGGGTVPNFQLGKGGVTGTKSLTLTGGTINTLGFDATVDLTLGGAVTIGTESEGVTVTTKTADGYTVVKEDTKYTVPFAYVDGTGATPGAFTDFKAAVTALPDAGGTVTFTGDTQVGTTVSGGGVTLPDKSGKVTVTSENGAKFIFARALYLGSELEFNNIEIHSIATGSGNLLCKGHKLTIAENVTTTAAKGALYLALIGGIDADTTYDTHMVIRAGTYRAIYGGGYLGTFSGHSIVEVSNVVSTGSISAENYTGTFNGTRELIFDLKDGKTVKADTYKHEPTQTLVDEGWAAAKVGDVYMQYPAYEGPAPTTVYVDASGKTEGAYTSFTYALIALAKEGGTIVVSGDTQFGTTGSGGGVVLSDYKDFTGGITFRSENGAKLIFARSFRLNCDVTFEDLNIHSIIPSGNTAVNNIICCGNTLTVGEGVVMTKASKAIWPSIIGGQDANTTYNTHVVVKGGSWQDIYAGGYSYAFSGNSVLEISNATVVGKLSAENRAGTFNGSSAMILDLRGGKTVTAGTYVTEPTEILVDEDYKAVLDGSTYKQEPLHTHEYTAEVTAPTCTEQGYTTYTCSCGDTYKDNYVDATGHVNTSETVVDATCTVAGSKTVTCACGEVVSAEEIPATGHTEVVDAAVEPTCTATGLTEGKHCSVCGEVLVAQTVIDALGHSHTTEVTAPTCTEKGFTTYTCACGDTYIGDEVAALGHTWVDATVDAPKTCSVCGAIEGEVLATVAMIGDAKYATLAEAVAAAKAGDIVTLVSDIALEKFVSVDKSITLDLGGKAIIRDGGSGVLYVNGADITVTITGGGSITGNQTVWAANGTVKIMNGTFTGAGTTEAVYVSGTGHAEIYGGTFTNGNGKFVLNQRDEDRATSSITVYGGTFAGFNPANNAAENAGTCFVADGYRAVEKDGAWIVELIPDVPGDVSGDGEVTVADVLLLVKAVLNDNNSLTNADMNGDGMLTLLDVVKVLKLITQ